MNNKSTSSLFLESLAVKMFKGGRPKDPIWSCFEDSNEPSKVRCKGCGVPVSKKADRLRTHLKKCSHANDVPVPTVWLPNNSIGDQSESQHVPDGVNAAIAPTSAKPVQRSILSHFVSTPGTTKDKLDQAVAEFVYGCKIPFAVVEHHTFRTMLELCCAGYKPPSRKALSEIWLNKTTTKLQTNVKHKLEGKTVTMQQDGWSTLQNDPVIATSVTCEGKGYFIDAVSTGATSKTAENCKDMLLKSKAYAEETYGCHVRSVVTDNARNMAKMREALKEEDEDIVAYGCLAHWLNLLGQDITSQNVMKHVVEINKYFRNHHIPSALLNDCEGSTRPQLPGDTRWKSQLTALDSYIKNRSFMMKIIQEHPDDIDVKIQKKVMDLNHFALVRSQAEMLRPVAISLDKAQSDSTGLADAYHIMNKLMKDPLLASCHGDVVKLRDQAILPCHMVAYMLHPKYAGKDMEPKDAETAREWLGDHNSEFLAAAIAFQAEASPYPKSFFLPAARTMKPVTWWQAVGVNSVLPDGFVDLMVTLHEASASSASLERIFSSFGLVMTKLRNRLGLEKAQKLVFCYRMLRGPTELDY